MEDNDLIRLDNTSQFFIMTPMVKAFHDIIKQWTWCGLIGGVIVGEPRTGKSFAANSIGDSIIGRSGEPIPVFHISLGERDAKKIRMAFELIALSLDFAVKKSESASDIGKKLKSCFIEASIMNRNRQVILLVDEIQVLSVNQMSVFAEIYNDLVLAKCNCSIYFIADQNRFEPIARDLLKPINKKIRERFFNHIHLFFGLRNSQEVKQCLHQYDRYVVNASERITATEYYCPSLYASGWRLTKIANLLWRIYQDDYMVPLQHRSWPMNTFVPTINILLMDYLPQYQTKLDESLLAELIENSLEAAMIKPSLQKFVKS